MVFHWFPVIGSTITYGINPIQFFFECREKYGDVFSFVLAGRTVTVTLGAKGNNFVLGGKTSHISAEDVYTNLTTPVFGKGVVYDCPNSTLMEQKKFVKFGLTVENFRYYTHVIADEVEKFLQTHECFKTYRDNANSSDAWGSFPAFQTMSELIIYTASRSLQGEEIRAAVDGSFADIYHDLDGGFKPINLLLPGLPLPMNIKRDKAQKKMSDFYVGIIEKRRAQGEQKEIDMLASLMGQRYRNGRTLSDREIAHIMIALLMAGQHTSSATSSWALVHLAARPDVWQTLYEEQVQNFSNGDGTFREIEYEDLCNLPILDSVIRETLRMHPPIHSILRQVKDDLVVPPTLATSRGGKPKSEDNTYIIPKGHLILASPAVSQLDPDIWKNANIWEPSRWSDPEGVAAQALDQYENGSEKVDYGFGAVSKGTSSPYSPFGAGRHRCIGEQFAYVQLGTVIANLVRKLEIKINCVPPHNYRTMIVVPETPDDISYRRRV
ncbi:cytochrome P450 [Cantharellus anzutake]|uniref:cytochrome P450 n=1 Tax=Cantharellus anzutake TaxID=1750568 RepID=UPI001904C385|nr:cytochrome P450 [Cantharellus anzutake]KAF8339763.1 cytochrome P450 [Cantharellus anzutake]